MRDVSVLLCDLCALCGHVCSVLNRRSSSFIGGCGRLWRHGIDAAGVPGMAAEQASDCEPRAAHRAVSIDRFGRIGRAARVKPALPAEKRAETQLVALDQQQQDLLHDAIAGR